MSLNNVELPVSQTHSKRSLDVSVECPLGLRWAAGCRPRPGSPAKLRKGYLVFLTVRPSERQRCPWFGSADNFSQPSLTMLMADGGVCVPVGRPPW